MFEPVELVDLETRPSTILRGAQLVPAFGAKHDRAPGEHVVDGSDHRQTTDVEPKATDAFVREKVETGCLTEDAETM